MGGIRESKAVRPVSWFTEVHFRSSFVPNTGPLSKPKIISGGIHSSGKPLISACELCCRFTDAKKRVTCYNLVGDQILQLEWSTATSLRLHSSRTVTLSKSASYVSKKLNESIVQVLSEVKSMPVVAYQPAMSATDEKCIFQPCVEALFW